MRSGNSFSRVSEFEVPGIMVQHPGPCYSRWVTDSHKVWAFFEGGSCYICAMAVNFGLEKHTALGALNASVMT